LTIPLAAFRTGVPGIGTGWYDLVGHFTLAFDLAPWQYGTEPQLAIRPRIISAWIR